MLVKMARFGAKKLRGAFAGMALSGAVLAGVAGVSVVSLTAAPAHAQFGMMGGGAEMMQDTVTRRGVDAYARLLEMDKDQKEAALALYEGHQGASRTMQKELQDKMAAMQEKMRDGEGFAAMQKEMPAMMKEYTAKGETLEKGFFADLKELCTEKQLTRWESVERYRRREQGMRFAFVSGSAVDLISVSEKLKAKPVNDSEYKETIQQYELEVDKLLVTFEKAGKDAQKDMFEPGAMFDMKRITEMMKKFYESAAQVRDVNRNYARKLEPSLTEEDKVKLQNEVKRRSFPRIYKPSRPQQVLDAAMGFSDLTPEQRESLKGIKEGYERDTGPINEKWAKATEEKEEKAGGTVMMMMQSFQPGGDGDDALKSARDARKELDEKTSDKIEALLTPEQVTRLPQKKAADPNPWSDFMPSQEEEEEKAK